MNSIEYANRVLHEFRGGKVAKSVHKGEFPLEVVVVCEDGTSERIHGYWACEIAKRLDEESKKTTP